VPPHACVVLFFSMFVVPIAAMYGFQSVAASHQLQSMRHGAAPLTALNRRLIAPIRPLVVEQRPRVVEVLRSLARVVRACNRPHGPADLVVDRELAQAVGQRGVVERAVLRLTELGQPDCRDRGELMCVRLKRSRSSPGVLRAGAGQGYLVSSCSPSLAQPLGGSMPSALKP